MSFASIKPDEKLNAKHFGVFAPTTFRLAEGDLLRITANGRVGGHRLSNGSVYRVKGFAGGDIVLDNNWVIPKNYQHLAHGYVTTSHASQGKTADQVLIAMGSSSLRAVGAEQLYVSVSRGRDRARVFTDVPYLELREAIARKDHRRSATDLMKGRRNYLAKQHAASERSRERAWGAIRELQQEYRHGRPAEGDLQRDNART